MVKNFLFHRVNSTRDKLWDPMDTGLFQKAVRYISSNYEVVLLEDLVLGKVETKGKRGRKLATIVFDDGYKDNVEYAAPILDRYGVKASFYVVTSCIDNNQLTWTHLLDYHFQATGRNQLDLGFSFLPDSLRVKKLRNDQERIAFARLLKPAIKKISHEQRTQVMERILEAFDDVELPRLMMDWDDLRRLQSMGHYIGSHTVTHFMLGTMQSETEVESELRVSAKRIKEELGYFPVTISYPVGSYDAATIDAAKKVGYKAGLAVKQRVYHPDRDSVYEIPRIELYNEPWVKTWLRIEDLPGRVNKFLGRK